MTGVFDTTEHGFGASASPELNSAILDLAKATLGAKGGVILTPREAAPLARTAIFDTPIRLEAVGRGSIYSALMPVFTSGPAVRWIAPAGVEIVGAGTAGVFLGNPDLGTCLSQGGAEILTPNPGGCFYEFHAEGGYFAESTTHALRIINDPVANVNGGVFTSRFSGRYEGGVWAEEIGDSNAFENFTVFGPREFYAKLVAGAQLLTMEDGNITAHGGTRLFGQQLSVCEVNFEQRETTTNPVAAVVELGSPTERMFAGAMETCHIGALTGKGIARLVAIRNALGFRFEDRLKFAAGDAGTIGIDILAESGVDPCRDIYVGPQLRNANIPAHLMVQDGGVGTIGTHKQPTLQNGWLHAVSTEEALIFERLNEGRGYIGGAIRAGAATGKPVLFQLPEGHRPDVTVVRDLSCNDGGSFVLTATVYINPDGTVVLEYCPAAGPAGTQKLSFDTTYPVAGGSHGVTAE